MLPSGQTSETIKLVAREGAFFYVLIVSTVWRMFLIWRRHTVYYIIFLTGGHEL